MRILLIAGLLLASFSMTGCAYVSEDYNFFLGWGEAGRELPDGSKISMKSSPPINIDVGP